MNIVTKSFLVSVTCLGAALLPASLTAAKVLPVLNSRIVDHTITGSGVTVRIDLDTIFGTEEIDDQAVRFTSQFPLDSSDKFVIDLALFSNRTPITRTNFLTYVNSGAYDNQFIHRRPRTDFVIQGGSWFVNSDPSLTPITPNDPIQNEFGISNTEWTLSMAKLSGDPDSATSGWFISISENSAILDPQNGGFTVFGRVLQSTQDDTAFLSSTDNFPVQTLNATFAEIPLNNFVSPSLFIENLNLFSSATLVPVTGADAGELTDLTYAVVTNNNESLFQASIDGNDLVLTTTPNGFGNGALLLTATDSVGNIVETTATFVVEPSTFDYWRSQNFTGDDITDDAVSGPTADFNNDGFTNLDDYSIGDEILAFRGPQTLSEFTINDTSDTPTLVFPFRNDVTDIEFTIEYSPDLGATPWASIPFNITDRTTDGILDTITVEIDTSGLTPGADAFFRRGIRFITN
ncbi:MAG: peptidylprolyl isomerase [Verrucomicrobiota bacterium]